MCTLFVAGFKKRTRIQDEGVSDWKEPRPKRSKRNAEMLKKVVVLLDTDVIRENGKVTMPSTIHLAQLRKPEKGQYNSINFTSEMTKGDVLRQLHLNFPILQNKR